MKYVYFSILQLILVAIMFLSFFSLAPWLACRPINELPDNLRTSLVAPENAVCFTANHGNIAFHSHGLIAEEPYRFGLHLAALLIPGGLLVWSMLSLRKFKRGAI